ncbi:MAG: response regulator transcription factor [Lachnospiraceae bacterium]|nr:response regulator transcription factor [Lachnospiraceae bacterium]
MLRIAICDDIYEARLQLRSLLERILERRGIQSSFVEFSAGERLLKFLQNHMGEVDLLFLDMKMMGMDGMETAERIRAYDENIGIVFVTSFADRVFDGYAVGALGYLMKPAAQAKLESVIDRVLTGICQRENETFFCRLGEVTYRIPYARILWFASERRTVTCVTKEREFTFYDKLDNVARQTGGQFVRIHQRYLVNARWVDSITAAEVHIGEHCLPISRSMKESALMALTNAALL